MNSLSAERTKLTVLGGFLGSGKTTWLRHQLHHGLMRDALVIVNEAADVPVDDALLFQSSKIIVLAGGCACCDGKDNLIAILRAFCDSRVDPNYAGEHFNHIVLETSGLADPEPIVEAIRSDPILIHHIVVNEIVVAVDAIHGMGYLRKEPLGRRQVETADRLIVTKIDKMEQTAVKLLLATLASINPGATISGATMGTIASLPPYHKQAGEQLPALGDSKATPVLSTTLSVTETIDWTAFSLWLSALLYARGDDIMRVKGVVRAPTGRLLLQSVRKVVQSPEILPEAIANDGADNCIVFIGRGFEPGDLMKSLNYFAGNCDHLDGDQ